MIYHLMMLLIMSSHASKLNFEVIAENTLDANCEDIWICVKT